MMFPNDPIQINIYVLSFIASLALSLGLSKLLIYLFINVQPVHDFVRHLPHYPEEKNIMFFGGVAVVLPFLSTLWIFYLVGPLAGKNLYLLSVITLCLGLMFGLGVMDDVFDFKAWIKFLVQISIATILYFSGIKIVRLGDWELWDGFSYFLTTLWVIGLTNAVNLIDGKDGLAGGVIQLSCATLFFIYFGRSIYESALLAVVLAGGILGFFCFNFPPAKIILGDTGSLSIGFLTALITLLPVSQGYTERIYYIIPVIALLYPIIDTVYSFSRRVLKGKNPFQKDQEHFHHRLIRLGLTPRQTILVLYAVCLFFNLSSLVPIYYINLIPKLMPLFTVFTLVCICALIYLLKYCEKSQKNPLG